MNGKLKLLIAYWLRSRFVTVWKFLLKASISADEFSLISPAGGSGLVGVGTPGVSFTDNPLDYLIVLCFVYSINHPHSFTLAEKPHVNKRKTTQVDSAKQSRVFTPTRDTQQALGPLSTRKPPPLP